MSKQWFLNSAALLTCTAAFSAALSAQVPQSPQSPRNALPGTVNYVEGQVSIDGNPLNTKQNGDTQLQPNESLTTANGKVEMLLTPGVFVRVGNNSNIRMVSNGLANPTIEVVRGETMVEVDQQTTGAKIDVLERGATASILKYGLFRFNGDQGRIEVIDGQLQVTNPRIPLMHVRNDCDIGGNATPVQERCGLRHGCTPAQTASGKQQICNDPSEARLPQHPFE